ncbi:hypothetical protein RyT2_11570 [Pseudolactococcus yaeyamensis]
MTRQIKVRAKFDKGDHSFGIVWSRPSYVIEIKTFLFWIPYGERFDSKIKAQERAAEVEKLLNGIK